MKGAGGWVYPPPLVILFLMRHGPAEDGSLSGRDFDRALTSSGRQCVERVAEALRERGERPGRLLSSPLVRARETAEIVARTLNLDLEVDHQLAPEGDLVQAARGELTRGTASVMLVGHEPDMSGASVAFGIPVHGFDRGMVVSALVEPGRKPVRRFVLFPRTLEWT